MHTTDLAAALRAAADLSADGICDDLAELCCAIGKAARPEIERRARLCRGDLSGRSDECWNTIAHVDRELDDATAQCIVTQDPEVAMAQAIRCAEAAALLGEDEAVEVRHLIADMADGMLARLEAEADTRDGSDGMPLPNQAMSALVHRGPAMRAAVAALRGA